MKFVNSIIYIEFADFIAAGYKEDTIKKANYRNGPYWQMIDDPADSRKVLVRFDTLRSKDQERLTAHFGNPYEYIAKEPIRKLVVADPKAEIFYREYRYDQDKALPTEYQLRYTRAASWLNMIIKATEDKSFIKKELNLRLDQFWAAIIELIKSDNIGLPTSYGNLYSKPDSSVKKYKADGYQALISGHFGNKRTAKIGRTEEGFCSERHQQQLAVIRKLARLHMNLDATQVTSLANQLFAKNGWSTLSSSTVANVMAQYMPSIISHRRGNKVFANEVMMQHKRVAPDFPTYYWTLDGWTVELAYQDGKRYDNRLVMVVVLDACNKYPVGYAIGERENTDLIRLALRNAIIHMQELFGAAYRPWQLQSDNYGIKNLTPFYEAASHLHFAAAVGNAKAKIIEPYFNYLNKTYCQLHFNWTGVNLTSRRENQPNIERLNEIKLRLPDKEGVIDQINRFMLKERLTKLEDFRNRWAEMPTEHQVTLSPSDCIEVFGKAHKHLNSITGHGLIVTLEGKELTYDSFDPEFRALQFATRFQVIYDPFDLNQVLAVTEDGKKKFLLHSKKAVGMGYMNTTPEQLEYRAQINQFNTQRKEELTQISISDDAIVAELVEHTPFNLSNDDEATLKLMFTDANGQQKERLQDAKQLRRIQQAEQKVQAKEQQQIERNWADSQREFITRNTDISQYLD